MTGSYQGVVPAASRVDVMGGAPLAPDRVSMSPNALSSLAGLPQVPPNTFGQGGVGRSILGSIGDALLASQHLAPIYGPAMLQQTVLQRQLHNDSIDNQYKMLEAAALVKKANQPQIEHVGNSIGVVDPDSGGFEPRYTAPTAEDQYATGLGLTKGTPDYYRAMQDYVLRGSGPTSHDYDVNMEGVRQSDRVALEGQRQSGRAALRATPTFGQAHPRPIGGIPGGFVGGRNSPAGTIPTANLLKQLGG